MLLRRPAGDSGSSVPPSKRPRYAHGLRETASLEEAVFGHARGVTALGLDEPVTARGELDAHAGGFVLDRAGAGSDDEASNEDRGQRVGRPGHQPVPAWIDADDAGVRVDVSVQPRLRKLRRDAGETVLVGEAYRQRLRAQFETIHGAVPLWADTTKILVQPTDADDDDVLRQGGSVLRSGSSRVPSTVLDTTRVKDANQHAVSQAVVQSCQFHPTAPALFTAGLDRSLRIFHVDGKANSLLQTIHLPDLPVTTARFSPTGNEIVLAGRRKFFYTYDLEGGSVRKIPELQGMLNKNQYYRHFLLGFCFV